MLEKPNRDFEDLMKWIGSLSEHRTYGEALNQPPLQFLTF